MPCWGIVFSTFLRCMSFHTAWTHSGLSKLPPSETYPGDPTSHLLHYFSPEITFALPEFKQHELLIRYHHRSGVFGTFNGVWGGSNVIALGYRYRFDR